MSLIPIKLMKLMGRKAPQCKEDIQRRHREWRWKEAANLTAKCVAEVYGNETQEKMAMKSDTEIREETSRFVLEHERNKAELKCAQSRDALLQNKREAASLEMLARRGQETNNPRTDAFTDKHFVTVTNFILGHGHDADEHTASAVARILGIGTRHVDQAFTDLVHMGILRQVSTDLRHYSYKLTMDGERKIATRAIEYVMGLNSEGHE